MIERKHPLRVLGKSICCFNCRMLRHDTLAAFLDIVLIKHRGAILRNFLTFLQTNGYWIRILFQRLCGLMALGHLNLLTRN